VTRLQAG